MTSGAMLAERAPLRCETRGGWNGHGSMAFFLVVFPALVLA
jgi:hypothetical protein